MARRYLKEIDEVFGKNRLAGVRRPVEHGVRITDGDRFGRDVELADKIWKTIVVHVLCLAQEVPLGILFHGQDPRESICAPQRYGGRVDVCRIERGITAPA